MRLRLARGWAQTHPRTLYLLQQEAQAWSRSGVLELTLDDTPADDDRAAVA
jgi:exopolyphosphatase/guanosine-5'-triphosphate,3'-diphosphate pyrophosphatase